MSKTKIFAPILILGLFVSACGGGNSGDNTANTTPTPVPLNDAQENLLSDINSIINITQDAGGNGDQPAASPVIARNHSTSTIEHIESTDSSPLTGEYYAMLSERTYIMNIDEIDKFRNPTLVREPGHTNLGKLALSVGTDQDENIDIVMLFNNSGNAVIALSSFDDFVAGGLPFEGTPSGQFSYSGVNYFKIGGGQIQSGEFGLSVNFSGDQGQGRFTSGLTGDIELDPGKGSYTGTVSLTDSTYENMEIKGMFHGNSNSNVSSVTGVYRGGPDTSKVTGAIIGTGTRN